MTKLIYLLSLLLTKAVFAQDLVVETYCFASPSDSQKAQQSAKYMMLPSDRIEPEGSCFSLFTTDTRRELIQKYLLSRYPKMRIDYSSVERRASETCDLQVEKEKKENTKSSHVYSGTLPGASLGHGHSSAKEVSQIKALSGAPFELLVDQQKITGKCHYINPTRYEIEFSMKFIPKPLIPPVPEGTIVVVKNLPPPEDQKGTNLSTTIQITKGERIEVGSIVKKLTDEGNAVSLIPQIDIKQSEKDSVEKIYLSVK